MGELKRFFVGHDALAQVSPAASPTTCYHRPFALALLPLEDCRLPPNLPSHHPSLRRQARNGLVGRARLLRVPQGTVPAMLRLIEPVDAEHAARQVLKSTLYSACVNKGTDL